MNDSLRADIQWRNRKTFHSSTYCDIQFHRSRYISHTPTTYGKRHELYTRRRVYLLVLWKSNITHSLTAHTTAPVYRRVSMNVLYTVNTTAVRFDPIHFSHRRQNTLAINMQFHTGNLQLYTYSVHVYILLLNFRRSGLLHAIGALG
jgi:hypothetical protein